MAGAAAVARSNQRRSKTKGNRKPKSKSIRGSQTSVLRVGGQTASFDNQSVGR